MSNLNLKVPIEFHKGLKAYALLTGKSMSQIIIDTVSRKIKTKHEEYTPETIDALEQSKANIGITTFNSLEELYKELKIGN